MIKTTDAFPQVIALKTKMEKTKRENVSVWQPIACFVLPESYFLMQKNFLPSQMKWLILAGGMKEKTGDYYILRPTL